MNHYITKNKKYMFISTIVLILLWWIVAIVVDNQVKIPTPDETWKAFVRIVMGKNFGIMLLHSIRRMFIGFMISFLAGIVIGMFSGFSNTIYYLLKPIILTMRSVPTMAVILLSLIWLNREISPILVGGLVIFPIIYSAVVDGIRNIDHKLMEMVQIYAIGKKQRIFRLYVPSIRSALASVGVAAFSLNVKISIAAEVLSQPKYGIGTGFQMERVALNTAGVFAWSFIAILIAGLFEWLIGKFFNKYSM